MSYMCDLTLEMSNNLLYLYECTDPCNFIVHIHHS